MGKEGSEGSTKYFKCPSMFETNDVEKFCYIALQQGKERCLPFTLTDARYKHVISVGNTLGQLQQNNNIEGFTTFEAVLLGNLHDIGYCFTASTSEHARIGGDFLHHKGYAYWQEVYWHGCPDAQYDSPILVLLDIADMTTGPEGLFCSTSQRVAEIATRYGDTSYQLDSAKQVVSRLKDRASKFNLNIPDNLFS